MIISSPTNIESLYGHSDIVRDFLDKAERSLEKELQSNAIQTIRIALLLATPKRIAEGAFAEFLRFDRRIGCVALGINGDFEP